MKEYEFSFPVLRIDGVPIKTPNSEVPYCVGFYDPDLREVWNEYEIELGVPIVESYTYPREEGYRYNANNGVLAILGRRGIYVTTDDPIKRAYLDEIGIYHDPSMFVPLSNGEELVGEMKTLWESMKTRRKEEILRDLAEIK